MLLKLCVSKQSLGTDLILPSLYPGVEENLLKYLTPDEEWIRRSWEGNDS